MAVKNDILDYDTARQIYRVLVMHYVEGLKQSEIAAKMDLSAAKVNRLIRQGRDKGMVDISIKSPFQPLLDIESALKKIGNLDDAMVTPTLSENPDVVLKTVGEAGANLLLEKLKDGDTICITGGKGVSALVAGLNPERSYDVEVVPATGCVQGQLYSDVNHVAAQLAEKLGGRAFQIHAPLFAETSQQKEMLIGMKSVTEILDRARNADIAIFGVGSILSADSSYYDLHPMPKDDQDDILKAGATGELLAHLLDKNGRLCDYSLNSKLVALSPEELAQIPLTMGIASGDNKIAPICSMLRGNHVKALVLDEATAKGVLDTI